VVAFRITETFGQKRTVAVLGVAAGGQFAQGEAVGSEVVLSRTCRVLLELIGECHFDEGLIGRVAFVGLDLDGGWRACAGKWSRCFWACQFGLPAPLWISM
jgi:hypothetical protein